MADLRRDDLLTTRQEIQKRITSLNKRIHKMDSKKWITDMNQHYEQRSQLTNRRDMLMEKMNGV